MTTADRSFDEFRATLHKAKRELDAISRTLEEEFTPEKQEGNSFYKLVQNVSKLEDDLSTLEREFYQTQKAKKELSKNSEMLLQNWTALEELRVASGLPPKGNGVLTPLQDVLRQMENEHS